MRGTVHVELVSLFVEGTPRPAGSLRIIPGRNGGRSFLAPQSSKTLNKWKKAIDEGLANSYFGEPAEGPISVELTFWMGRPKSHSTSKGLRPEAPAYPLSKTGDYAGDFDKLTRAVCDCLSGVVIVDDSQIVDARIRKRHIDAAETFLARSKPGVEITVSKVTDELDVLFAQTGETP